MVEKWFSTGVWKCYLVIVALYTSGKGRGGGRGVLNDIARPYHLAEAKKMASCYKSKLGVFRDASIATDSP